MLNNQKEFKLIVVDDDPDDQFLIRDAFNFLTVGLKITSAYNGANLLDILKQSLQENELKPDLIVMDVNMPILDGYETLRRLKLDPSLRDIPVFMLSTTISPDKIPELKALGALEYFAKPSNMTGYRKIVEQIFSHF